MAFSFPGSPPAASSSAVNAQTGQDLADIQTENLGWLALAGESKVQLLPSAWPSDQLPPPTSSLLSIASHKGLLAASGPAVVIVATTESVRKAFEAPSTDGNVKPFQPQLSLPMGMRISQLAFTTDESYLVLSAEVGGGLAVYDVGALLQNSTQTAFELSTNGQALRALVPNPTAEKGELIALVTNDGNLMMANLKERKFNTGSNGQILKAAVSCISWSTKGKQLVAGLANGSAYQMTPEGEGKADIPRPPNAAMGDFVSSITWLENNCFLMVLTPSNFDGAMAPTSTFYVVNRDTANLSNFIFQKITDPVGAFAMNRSPPHHFLLRLRDFPPNLQDVLVVSSTASNDIGLFSRSKVPLTNDKPADQVTGVFTMTEMADDSRRAALPMSAELNDTSPIGLAFDLSSKEKVHEPIPTYEEISESPTPLPALMVLNNEGVLASWWFIYSDSIRQGTIYTGLVAAGVAKPVANSSPAITQAPVSAFGGLAKPTFGSPAAPGAFGAPAALGGNKSVWGTPSSTGAFGSSSSLGQSKSPWGTPTTTIGSMGSTTTTAPAFGTSAFATPAFGQTSTPSLGGLGNKASPWATGSTSTTATFGQSGGTIASTSVFGASTSVSGQQQSGFASFADKGGFATTPSTGGSIFGASPKPIENPPAKTNSLFGTTSQSPFGTSSTPSTSVFGTTALGNTPAGLGGPFVLGSTFKPDPLSNINEDEPKAGAKGSFFGGDFGGALSNVNKKSVDTESKDDEMVADDVPEPERVTSDLPIPVPAKAPQPFGQSTPSLGSLFGSASPLSSMPAVTQASTGLAFGQPTATKLNPGGLFTSSKSSVVPAEPVTPITTSNPTNPFGKTPSSPVIKQEQNTSQFLLSKIPEAQLPSDPISKSSSKVIPEAPLPTDPTTKATFTAGDSSNSSFAGGTDAPLPPDFVVKATSVKTTPSFPPIQEKRTVTKDLIPPSDVPGGPVDDGNSSGFLTEDDEGEQSEEGSGEDVAKDLSPVSEARPTPGFSPDSSFGGMKNRSGESSIFGKMPLPVSSAKPRALFGEIGLSAPMLPPPKVQQSPRSPSPIRNAIPPRMSRPDASRSVSAPGIASQILGSQRTGGHSTTPASPGPGNFKMSVEQKQAEERRRAETEAKKEAEETKALEDEEDDRMQLHLASDITPTKVLDEFEAHANYVNNGPTESIPSQVEAVYRDINAMIDTLGLNARSLKGFIQGHTELYKEAGRTRTDLEDDDDWCLVEIEDLSAIIETDLARDLDSGRVKDIGRKLESCNSLQKDLSRLRAKHEDVKKIVDSLRDPDQLANARAQPLSAEQMAQQNDLRRDFANVQKLLSDVEQALTILRVKIASQPASQGRVGGTAPTVEAVVRTISKMTSMAEKRSGDIDVLEGQMRRLRFTSTGSVGSREGSPFATPQKNNRASVRNLGGSSYGLFYTPDSTRETTRFQSSVMSSTSSLGRSISPRKKMSGFTDEDKMALRKKLSRKKEVADKLRAALEKTGTHVRTMEDD